VKKPRILRSFQKGLLIWKYIATYPDGARLVDIADRMDLPASDIILYMNTLVGEGLIIRDSQTKKFFISPETKDLFYNAPENLIHQLLPCSDKPMHALLEQFNENVVLATQKDSSFKIIKYLDSGHRMRVSVDPADDYYMHITATGRAILSFLPQKEIDRYIQTAAYVQRTDKTIHDEASLRSVLDKTRKNGYAFNPGEFETEIMAVAAPIIINDRPIASLAVQFPTIRHSEKDAESVAPFIMKQAREIEKNMKQIQTSE
jgi:IclR family acetate operon transcriptional repressor